MNLPTVAIIPYAIALFLIAGSAIILQRVLTPLRDAREPPYLPSGIPLIGHFVSLMRKGSTYFSELDEKYRLGIYTLPVLNGRGYIINSPEWAVAMHKATKTLSFNSMAVKAFEPIFGLVGLTLIPALALLQKKLISQQDKSTIDIIKENINNEKGNHRGLLLESERMIYSSMGHGKELDELNISFLNLLAGYINNLAPNGDPESIGLWKWVRHHFAIASATSVWGPLNPLAVDSSLCEDFWTTEQYLMAFFFVPFPAIFIRKGYKAQHRLFDAWTQYGLNDGWKKGGQFAKNRAQLSYKYGLTKKMYGLNENSVLSALLVNTVPSAFWLLSHVFADPILLANVRQEVDGCVRETNSGNQKFINATLLKTQCPLLNSALRENLRIVGPMNINRVVLEDTLLTNHSTGETSLVKKGGIVTVAANVIHMRPEIFGADVRNFNVRRFLPTVARQGHSDDSKVVDIAAPFRDEEGKVHSGSFRTFGGGNNICPGRHFAQTEMLSLTALFVAGFEIESADGGQYVPPPLADPQMLQGVIKPKKDAQVNVKRREGFEYVQWAFDL